MEFLHFGIRSGKHGSAEDHIAYVTRQGRHASRDDLAATGFGNMPAFAEADPMLLWTASGRYERKNGSTFRSFVISLPNGLTVAQLEDLSWKTARRLAGSKPFQFALHVPKSSLEGALNPHVHVVICDRLPDEYHRTPEQMFKRYNPKNPEAGGCRKDSGGRSPLELRAQLRAQRKAVAEEINSSLAANGHELRVDHRTLRERGVTREPERYLGPARIRKMTAGEREEYVRRRKARK